MPDPRSSDAAGRSRAGPPLLGGTGKGLPVTIVVMVVGQQKSALTTVGPPVSGTWANAIGTRINIARRAAVARKIALFTSPPSLGMCYLLLAPRSMPHNKAWRI